MKTFAEAEAVLAERLPGYTPRPQQQEIAQFIEGVIAESGHGMAEAGCGVGKSLATMIPAILSGRKTVVATATIALQNQYAEKDIPFLQEHLGVDFSWALIKGRANYLCWSKITESDSSKIPVLPALVQELQDNPDHAGDQEALTTEISERDFKALTSSSADCPGKRNCPFGDVCFAERAKAKGKDADVIITNQMMLMTDLKIRELSDGVAQMLGDYELVLVDEAHELIDYATNALSDEIRPLGIKMLVREATTLAHEQDAEMISEAEVVSAMEAAWDLLPVSESERERETVGLGFFSEHLEAFVILMDVLRKIQDDLESIKIVRGDSLKMRARQQRLLSRVKNYLNTLDVILTTEDWLMVRWAERVQMSRDTQVVLKYAPVEISAFLNEWLWESTPAVLVSATLSTGGDFSYLQRTLGVPQTAHARSVGTPFDYKTQAMTFVPSESMPSPKERGAWQSAANAMTRELVSAAGGGALLLFTSRSAMDAAYDTLGPIFTDMGYTCLKQGMAPNQRLAEQFASDTHSILFGMKSFMTGVDFQGDACRLVVLDKLPFPVPTEPVFKARVENYERQGGDSFNGMTIPMMTLTLEQAYGRLIRTVTDRGVVAILDSRLSSTGYGKRIVRSLPDSPVTTSLQDVRDFFGA